jgi:probable HAF family extracellular repeat protein
MQTRTAKGAHGRSGCRRWWPPAAGVFIALAASVTTALAAPAPVPANTTYRIIQLSPWGGGGAARINAKGQVAFIAVEPITAKPGDNSRRAKFYDGNVVRDLGTLGGPIVTIAALNDAGQVAGTSRINATSTVEHAFRWSKETGMVKLAPPGVLSSSAFDINSRGWVAGTAQFPGEPPAEWRRAFRWTPQTGMVGLGALERGSRGSRLNDAGTVVGSSASRAVRWPGTTPVPLESGGLSGFASDINNAGQVVGGAERSPGFVVAVLWTPQNGLVDLGLRMGSGADKINANGLVIGNGYAGSGGPQGFVWCRENGLVMLGQKVTAAAYATDLNNLGQVVGSLEGRPFVWTRAEGVVILDRRIPDAPPGLSLVGQAYAISDNGTIVAGSNTGLVLLVPGSGYREPPVASPVQINGTQRSNALLSFSASFRDVDVRDRHKAVWSWGDGSQSVGTVSASPTGTGGTGGGVFGQHAYTREGRYLVRLTVTDSSGKSTTVTQLVVVDDA